HPAAPGAGRCRQPSRSRPQPPSLKPTSRKPKRKDLTMISRRDYLKLALAASATLAIKPSLLWAQDKQLELITRAIPSTGEKLPVVGLGSSATFSQVA